MEKETYEKVIEALVEKLRVTEYQLGQYEKKIKELKVENEKLRSEK